MAQHIVVGDRDATFNKVVREILNSPTIATLTSNWSSLAMELDHPSSETQLMRQGLLLGTKTQSDIILELLTNWRARNASNATLQSLCERFRAIEMNDIADRLLLAFVRVENREHVDVSATVQAVTNNHAKISRRQIIYTEELTPKYLFNRTYLHLRTNVLPYNSEDVMEAIVGEASIKLGLEQLESVQNSRIPVTERWKNLKGVVESRQGLYADSYEKFLDVLINMDHLQLKSFSEGIYLYIQNIKTA